MRKTWSWCCARTVLILASLCFLHGGAVMAAEFSADTISTRGGETITGKVFVKGDKIRNEGVRGGRETIAIVRMDKKLSWVLQPENKTYIEMKGGGAAQTRAEMESAVKGMADKKELGTEKVNGFLCDKVQYVYRDKSMGVMTQWIARDLDYPIKSEHTGAAGGGFKNELTNIKVKSLPDSLFEVPAGYKNVPMPDLKMPKKEGP
jgi:hypothetical protein